MIANGQGNELKVNGASHEIQKINADVNEDVNGDGNISIGDLAIIAAAYGKEQDQSGWNDKADVNNDSKVDILDLAIVAKAILQ
ncbi:Dockerin type I repeat protein [compost metagenome]